MTEPNVDIIDQLAGITPGSDLDELRRHRQQARDNAQRSFSALLEPEQPGTFGYDERYAVATLVAGLHGFDEASRFYRDLLSDAIDDETAVKRLSSIIDEVVTSNRVQGPFGIYREPQLANENRPGPDLRLTDEQRDALGARLSAAFELAQILVLHPRDSRPEMLVPLSEAGWSTTDLVSLEQLIAFLAFQLRSAWGLRALAGTVPAPASAIAPDAAPAGSVATDENADVIALADEAHAAAVDATGEPAPLPADTLGTVGTPVHIYPELARPTHFVQHSLGWVPWLEPLAEDELTDRHREALVEEIRAKNPYFRLLVRDPDALEARTLTDMDIFFNVDDGIGRAERELSATVTSRVNGCVYCASVHSARASKESEAAGNSRREDVQRLLDRGVGAGALNGGAATDLGDDLWNAIERASAVLTLSPLEFGEADVDALRSAGLDDLQVIDIINGAAFFNWANRLMLGLGEPEVPKRFLGQHQE
ncbi:alkylhydroperoxidase domain protein [Pseudoclavibacter sp. 13-3]|uniref:alkylhydroperoxidase domain protein n=1 Tax=Pseudoclavibacter sp. 13-3 TaxID=2901228 RepID=UPI002F90E8A6